MRDEDMRRAASTTSHRRATIVQRGGWLPLLSVRACLLLDGSERRKVALKKKPLRSGICPAGKAVHWTSASSAGQNFLSAYF